MKAQPLFRPNQAEFAQQYAALRKQSLTAGALLPGTPGTLQRRTGTGYAYWYRVYYPVPGKQAETLVGRENDQDAENAMRAQMAAAESVARQVGMLRKLGYFVADKITARALVELHNLGAFDAGLILTGSLACLAWLNEFGARVQPPTGEGAALHPELFATQPFLDSPLAGTLPLTPDLVVTAQSGLHVAITLPGIAPIPCEVIVAGDDGGTPLSTSPLAWSAITIPDHDYLTTNATRVVMLAGGQCIPVRLPDPAHLVWHQLYASTQHSAARADNERHLALSLAAALLAHDPWPLLSAWETPPPTITGPIHPLRETLLTSAAAHPDLQELLADCLNPAQ